MTESALQADSTDDGDQAEYLDLFHNRYTLEDPDYKLTVETPLAPPPCVDNWYSRPKRIYDWAGGRGRGRGRGGHRGGYHEHRGGYRDNRASDRDNAGGYRQRDHDHQRQGPSRAHYPGMKEPAQYRDHQNRHHPYGQQRDDRHGYQGQRGYRGNQGQHGYRGQDYYGNNSRGRGGQTHYSHGGSHDR